jgi:hypothetical protein
VFTNNIADEKGGAVFYNLNRPQMTNNQFQGNTALYGPNVGSYPVKIAHSISRNTTIKLEEVTSGLTYESSFTVNLIDYDGQTVNIENSTTVKINPITPGAYLSGTDFAKVIDGKAIFNSITFNYIAGASNVFYSLSSSAINQQIVTRVLNGSSSADFETKLDIDFRD